MTKFYATKIINGKEVSRKEIGTARTYGGNTISARKYNKLKRSLFNAYKSQSGATVVMITEDGLKDSFGGYPATGYVKFN